MPMERLPCLLAIEKFCLVYGILPREGRMYGCPQDAMLWAQLHGRS